MPIQSTTQMESHIHQEQMKMSRLMGGLTKVLVPAIAMMSMALGSTPAQAAESKIKIGVTMALFDDVWLTLVRNAMIKWGSKHPDVDLTIVDASNDTAKQVGQVENFLAQGMDAVVILPVDTAATGPMTKSVEGRTAAHHQYPLCSVQGYFDDSPGIKPDSADDGC